MQMRDALLGGLFACLGIFMMVQAAGFPAFPGQPYGASLLPGLLGAGFIIAGGILAAQDLLGRVGAPWVAFDEALRSRNGLISAALMVATVLAHILLGGWLGFIPVALVTLCVIFLWFGVRLLPALLIAAASTALCWVLFAIFLEVPLPRGLLVGIV
ncbi:tripartite tricarboxylate transporter TctB family protein [Oceanicola sp. D3]|uniref:tripartite tricarboxylate transporter TctB family protein n=1 Tax=Oceanicola sp. D3 TaxID=2587163 RepID=UPI001122CFBE|nr:tripartite tricarboxylate transporter TctB family protein [Oceanicola sp. D3]QDC10642.1 tripartite tricarboxylate transporter TctB family protein [Oceanicola sp. D3]